MDDLILERIYQEKLEERLILCLSEKYGLTLEQAMEMYYHSKLAFNIWIIKFWPDTV